MIKASSDGKRGRLRPRTKATIVKKGVGEGTRVNLPGWETFNDSLRLVVARKESALPFPDQLLIASG